MDADVFLEDLKAEKETPLSRLGSSKSLYALTGGEMAEDAVRTAAAGEADVATDVFESWSADEGSGDAAAVFGAVADAARRHRDAVAGAAFDPADARAFPEYEVLSGLETTAARAGGLLARCLVAEGRAGQMVGFFVGSADPAAADDFRALRDDLADAREDALDLLGEVCETDEDWTAAREAAEAVIEAAYEDYVETLEGMGVKPKNVC